MGKAELISKKKTKEWSGIEENYVLKGIEGGATDVSNFWVIKQGKSGEGIERRER